MSSSAGPKSGSGQSFRMSEGDWICDDQNCQNINFARRVTCNLCARDRPTTDSGTGTRHKDRDRDKDRERDRESAADKKRKIGHEIGKVAAEKSKGLFSADDWQCGRCGNVNWARRSTCNMCSAPKFGDNEERTGLGGGYNEREEHVEYVEREESDGEYDDFGRKKKKRLRSDSDRKDSNECKHKDNGFDDNLIHSTKTQNKSEKNEDNSEEEDEEEEDEEGGDVSKYKLESDEEEEDEEGGDVSKYKLESDEEEEDEEDDDDEDLSKYDLSDCIEDKK